MLRVFAFGFSSTKMHDSNEQSKMFTVLTNMVAENRINDIRTNSNVDCLRKNTIAVVKNSTNFAGQDIVTTITDRCSELVAEGQRIATSQEVLKSLHFSSIKTREHSIKDAHAHTLEWTYNTQFVTWSQSREGIYWIDGKAGSGKSTLMKYLYNNPRTRHNLEVWISSTNSNPRANIVVASYFSWSGDTKLQKSQQGLLQSLLHHSTCQSAVTLNNLPQISVRGQRKIFLFDAQ
ncbi:hypothetical protein ACMFMG_001450 [Clarireedia jacksonii]